MVTSMAAGSPVSWPVALYETDHAIGLTVCIAHRGAHAWYLDGCQTVGAVPAPSIGPFGPCALHAGRHLYVRGHCLSPGRRYAYRYGRCPAPGCGVEVCHRLDVLSGRTDRLDAETDRPHRHEPAVQVEIDEGGLAYGIAAALHQLMERRRQTREAREAERASSHGIERLTFDRPGPDGSPAGPAGQAIPTVTVWSPGSDDGTGT